MTSANDVRRTFIEFFKKNGHEAVASSPLVPRNDPTMMFTNSGMVQFKNVFTGVEKRPYSRATTAQKCVRAGGKHNDLDNVGFTARHHTFFEMLGNFSFGDYFKEQAISFAWDLINKEFDMPKDRLLVTVYSEDEEAAKLWKSIAGFTDDRIIRIPTHDNFWMMGDTGPCGPCSEIFYDHGDKVAGGPPGSADQDGDRYIEFWNNVFMQFEQLPDGSRINMPKQSIDTGMGLERMTALLQGSHDNYSVDLLRSIIETTAQLTNTDPDGPKNVSHRVIADHLRSAAFLIAEGVMPSNEGRGYVLRRIMRRGMRHAHLLGATEPLMYRLLPTLQAKMGATYPELNEAGALIAETLKQEETRFKKTLDHGLSLLATETAKLGDKEPLSGDVAFKLYDTFGFPLDLTQDVLKREQSREVDVAGFESAMEKQRETARKSWAGSGEAATETVWFGIKEKTGVTEFLGYQQEQAEGQVLALVNAKGEEVQSAKAGEDVMIVVNQTPFYAESGGQVGDHGWITTAKGGDVVVGDCVKKLGGLFVHVSTVKKGDINVGDAVEMKICTKRRDAIRANHSATHLLHAALHRHLGKHVVQKGSLVDDTRLRFDISQPVPIEAEQRAVIEAEVNDRIRMNSEVNTRLLPIDDARALGAMAMFGEKYDDEVRVVSLGGADPEGERAAYSLELCGGTHVRRTGDIGLFRIVSESALAAGIRRVEAVTGAGALKYLAEQETRVQDIAAILKSSPAETVSRVEALVSDKKKLEKEIADLRRKLATGGAAGAAPDVKTINGVKFSARVLEDVPANELKPMADDLKAKLGSGVVALVSVSGEDGKASLVVAVTPDLVKNVNAVDLVKTGSAVLGGKGGGGRPDMAQAGGPDGKMANDAVAAIEAALAG
ncbi:MAG: alanine--tRNA ligase [Bdellovibrionales bacterium]|jgi:alanyl-tRNA synthetase|nr:alanine--tRNA ligase [Bdellovibrionales bacterium]